MESDQDYLEVLNVIEISLKFRLFDNVFRLCEEYFTRYPTPQILFFYVQAMLDSGAPLQAILLCKRYEGIVFCDCQLQLLYAKANYECGKFADAEMVLKRVNLLSIEDQQTRVQLQTIYHYISGLVQCRTHRFIPAQTNFTESLKLQPLMIGAYQNMIQNFENDIPNNSLTIPFLKLSNEPISTDVIDDLPEPIKESIPILKSQAYSSFKSAKYGTASKFFSSLYYIHPYTMDGIDIYSTVLWHLKDINTLNELVRRTQEIAPNRPETWIAAGNLLSLQRDCDNAIRMFMRAANIDKSCSYALALAGHEYLIDELLTDGSNMYRQSIDRNPMEWSAWYGLGSVHFKRDNFVAAEYYTKKAIELNPYSSVLYYALGMILRKAGRENDALQQFDRSLELEPSNCVAAFQKSLLLYDQGKLDEAKECLAAFNSFTHQEPDIAYLRGKIAQQQNNIQDMVLYYSSAIIYGQANRDDIPKIFEEIKDELVNSFIPQSDVKNYQPPS